MSYFVKAGVQIDGISLPAKKVVWFGYGRGGGTPVFPQRIATVTVSVSMGWVGRPLCLKGPSHEIDFKNFDKNLQNLA